ncbi:MAG: hypothetical protein NTZ05_12295 [Chloroflexi bacterium]|nr:hypothetical protein [Chloroflexota bacterium]
MSNSNPKARPPRLVHGLLAAAMFAAALAWPRQEQAAAQWMTESVVPWEGAPSMVAVEQATDGTYRYIVNGAPQVIVGIGYNPIYRELPEMERSANYRRDFRLLCQAGVNHITGWDADKGYEQDKFDEVTLDLAQEYGIGVIMPMNLPPHGDYEDPLFLEGLRQQARAKIERFKLHPALRMWGVGNEVLTEMPPEHYAAYALFYGELADLFHALDPNHPVIYREAEDTFIPELQGELGVFTPERPWLLYGANAYTAELESILDRWPSHGLQRPLLVSEFGAEGDWPGGRSIGYLSMWRMIRAHSEYVLGGAPYVWTVAGPEPVDEKWGLMDVSSAPIDATFAQLSADWRRENNATLRSCPP